MKTPTKTVHVFDGGYEYLEVREKSLFLRILSPGGGETVTNVNSLYLFLKEMFTTDWQKLPEALPSDKGHEV